MELVLFLSYQSVTNPIHHVLALDWRHQAIEWSQPTENDLSIMIALLLLFVVVSALSSFPISPSHFAKTKQIQSYCRDQLGSCDILVRWTGFYCFLYVIKAKIDNKFVVFLTLIYDSHNNLILICDKFNFYLLYSSCCRVSD